MAVVYMAEQQEPIHRKIALKIIKLGMDTRQVMLASRRSAKPWLSWTIPILPKCSMACNGNGRPYFVMELVRGVSITEYCDQAGCAHVTG